MKKVLFVIISLALLLGLCDSQSSQLLAQAQECGNGLLQRLKIGVQAWIEPTPPVKSVRVRQQPGKPEVARLNPGVKFTVTDGPICFEDASWWEIETESAIKGWIAEGVEVGAYFVEPIIYSPIEVKSDTCNFAPASFLVGQYVKLMTEPRVDILFYGNPLVSGAYFSLLHYFQNDEYDNFNDYLPQFGGIDSSYLLTDGPVCINGSYFWQIHSYVSWFWVNEQYLHLSPEQPVVHPVFAPHTLSLTKPSATIVSPELQVAFDSSGGGGGGAPLLNIFLDGCLNPYWVTTNYEYRCVTVYPFPVSASVNVVIKQADGVAISEFNVIAEPIELEILGGETRSTQTSGIRVYVPTKLGITTGRYLIEATNGTKVRNVAYEFYDSHPSTEPYLNSYCDAGKPILIGTGFDSRSEIEVVFVEETQATGKDIGRGTVSFREKYRWKIDAGERGEFLATIDLNLPQGYFVLANEDGSWEDNFPDYLHLGRPETNALVEPLSSDCVDNSRAIPDFISTSDDTLYPDIFTAFATITTGSKRS